MNDALLVFSALFMAFAVFRGRQARRDWSAGPGGRPVQRTVVAQVIILAGAALVLSGDGAKPRPPARPGPESLVLGLLGVLIVVVGVVLSVLILTRGAPRFLIPPQGRVVAGAQGGAAAAVARNPKSRPATTPKATRGASAALSEDELLDRLGPARAKGARRLRKSVKEISLMVPMPPKQAVARTREIIDDLGSVAGQDRGAGSLQVIGVVGSGAPDMNPAVVTVTISRSGEGSSVVVRGAAKAGLIKQRASQDAAKRVAAELGAPRGD